MFALRRWHEVCSHATVKNAIRISRTSVAAAIVICMCDPVITGTEALKTVDMKVGIP